MSKVQVLVTTMHETNLDKFVSMNIQSDVVFANQKDSFSYTKEVINGHTAEMITTPTRGVSKNRNIAIAFSGDTEYIVFSDDDLRFLDGYEEIVINEFENHKEAEAIKFNLDCVSERKLSIKPTKVFKKANFKNYTACGMCGFAIKKDVLIKANLGFNEYFGPGSKVLCGEDTIFLHEVLEKKVKFYFSPKIIAQINLSSSSWHKGYDDREFGKQRFMAAGATLAAIYPHLSRLLAVRSAYKFSKRNVGTFTFKEILDCYMKGISEYLTK